MKWKLPQNHILFNMSKLLFVYDVNVDDLKYLAQNCQLHVFDMPLMSSAVFYT